MFPYSICYWEEVFYIGDNVSVQLWTNELKFLQRIGESIGTAVGKFHCVRGICIVKGRLHVNDKWNNRMQIFGC